jgi:hypothetical protein
MVLVSFGLAQTPCPTPDISAMVAKIKAAKTANKPFVIYLNDGSTVTVANAGCLAQNPSGNLRRYVF